MQKFGVLLVLMIGFIPGTVSADVCVYKPPKVDRICGTVVDPMGAPLVGATVKVLKEKTAIKSAEITESGEFDFSDIQPGIYELVITAPGYETAGGYRVTLRRQSRSCRNALRVGLSPVSIHCHEDIQETKKPLPSARKK